MKIKKPENLDYLMELALKSATAYVVIVFMIFAGTLFFNSTLYAGIIDRVFPSEKSVAVLGETQLILIIADDPEERERGLSYTASLPEKQGLFFIYEDSGMHGIWMKDMNYSIDILWLDSAKEVIDIVENASPESFPKVFLPNSSSKYVLEVNAGFVKKHGIKKGDLLTLFR